DGGKANQLSTESAIPWPGAPDECGPGDATGCETRDTHMANGQPRPAFYVAVLVVIIGLVGMALWRYGAIGPRGGSRQVSTEPLKQMKGGAEAPDTSGITTVKEYKYVPEQKLPPVKGISSYKPMNDRTVRFAINVWAGWGPIIFANNGFKAGKVWQTPAAKL